MWLAVAIPDDIYLMVKIQIQCLFLILCHNHLTKHCLSNQVITEEQFHAWWNSQPEKFNSFLSFFHLFWDLFIFLKVQSWFISLRDQQFNSAQVSETLNKLWRTKLYEEEFWILNNNHAKMKKLSLERIYDTFEISSLIKKDEQRSSALEFIQWDSSAFALSEL